MRLKTDWYLVNLILFIILIISPACSGPTPINSASSTQIPTEEIPAPTVTPEMVSGSLGKQLDDYFVEDNPLFSGSVLVAEAGDILLARGYNYANWELKVPNSSQTKFRISSITKPITATLIMMLSEQDLIELDDQLCTLLPNCPAQWRIITIRNLLNHTSGIPEYTTLLGAGEVSRDPHNVAGLIDMFRDEPLNFSPGESYEYSNSNYILLGAVIEQVAQDRYGAFLQQVLLDPLDMKNSGLDSQSEILADRASGYQIQGTWLVNAPYLDMTNAYATAGMYSTVEDLYRWDQALYTDQLLTQESVESMFTPNFGVDGSGGEYGLGWQISEYQGHRKVGHTGGINGFHTYIGRYIDDQVTIIVLSNIETDDILKIVSGMEELIFGRN